MKNKNNLVLLHLSLILNIGPASVLKIIKKLFDDFYAEQKNPQIQGVDLDLEKLYKYKVSDFRNEFGLSEKSASLLVSGLSNKSDLEKELDLIEKYKIDYVTFLDSKYPKSLKEIHSPPVILYCKGAPLECDEKKFSVVGARKANSYAYQVVNDIIPKLVANNYTIVSGGATGVDSMAHRVTVGSGGKTIVVFGSGLLHTYPKENRDLFRKVVQTGGTLVSPFPLDSPPISGNFPARNRIISGLSSGCLVVQAAQKSGSLITAQFALDDGRQVFAVPGNVEDELSIGCHNLIKQGAKLVGCVDDILEEFGEVNCSENKLLEEKKVKKDEEIQKEPVVSCPVLNVLQSVVSIDELSLRTGLDLELLQEKLFDLQLEGKVKQNVAGFWEKM